VGKCSRNTLHRTNPTWRIKKKKSEACHFHLLCDSDHICRAQKIMENLCQVASVTMTPKNSFTARSERQNTLVLSYNFY